MRNVTCRTRSDAISLFQECNRILNAIVGNCPTYVAIEGDLLVEYLRFLALRDDKVPWGVVAQSIHAYLRQDPVDFLIQVSRFMASSVRSDREWKARFGDDELFGPLHWFNFRYIAIRADAQSIVLQVHRMSWE